MHYKHATIFYMTGTGNSYRTATWIKNQVTSQGGTTELVQIGKENSQSSIKKEDLIGLTFPTHAFTAPWPMLRFALSLPRKKGIHAFVVPTRAGTKLGKICFPGMEGTSGYLLASILALKGYSVRGVMGLDMPSNWTALHWGFQKKNAEIIIARGETKTQLFMKMIFSGRHSFRPGSFIELLWGLLLLPVSFAYMVLGRFFLAKLFFANFYCNGCRICAEACPHQAIIMRGDKNLRPYWTFRCESCMRCMNYCPQKAVEAGHSLGVIFYYITMVPVPVYLLNRLSILIPGLSSLNASWIHNALQYPYILLSMYITYLCVSFLIRIPFFNRIFTYTTFTHLYRRYHEPNTRLNEISMQGKK